MSDGWIKIHRRMNSWEWKDTPNTFCLFMHLLINANHKDGKHKGVLVKAGQIKTGRKSLALNTGLSEQQVRTSLKHLKKSQDVTIRSTKEYSIITITNWKKYQDTNQPPTNLQPTSNHKQECKNVKNEKKDIGVLIEVPNFINSDIWDRWIKHRKEIKKKLTPTQADGQIKKLKAWHAEGVDINRVIESSIANGWTGLFKPKHNTQKRGSIDDELQQFLDK